MNTPLVGILYPGLAASPAVDSFVAALRALGYRDRETIRLAFCYSGADRTALIAHAAELVALRPQVIVAFAGEAIPVAVAASNKIPVVSAAGDGDFVARGLAADWERPGGHFTGMNLDFSIAASVRVQILKVMCPSMRCVCVPYDPSFPASPALLESISSIATSLRIEVSPLPFRGDADFDGIDRYVRSNRAAAIVTAQGPLIHAHTRGFVGCAHRGGVPLAMGEPGTAEAGALLQVNVDVPKAAAASASFVDRILRGEHSGDIPIRRFSEMRRVGNARVAGALGIKPDPIALACWGDIEFLY